MRKILIVLAILLVFTFSVHAQIYDWDDFDTAFSDFATGVAGSLPMNAAIGLNWSPAYIGKFPHFGVGLTVGFSTIPYSAMQTVINTLGVTIPPDMDFLKTLGIPFPGVALDARLGGFVLPFDIGFKLGFIPAALKAEFSGFTLDYLMIGGDVRYQLIKERFIVPSISVGLGYTYLRGGVGIPDLMGGSYRYNLPVPPFTNEYLEVTSPSVNFHWQTHTFELKAQLSKRILIFTPYLGIGAAYGISQAGGGVETSVSYFDGSSLNTITQPDIDAIRNGLAQAGYTLPEISATGILVDYAANGFAFRAFGGMSVNLWFLWVDLGAMYNIVSGSLGAAINVRVQF